LSEQKEVQFILDTGASVTIFDTSLKREGSRAIDKGRFETSAGTLLLDIYPCPRAMIGTLDLQIVPTVAFADLAPLRAAIGHDIMGILGVDFLGHYAVEIDFDLGTLRLWESAPQEWVRGKQVRLSSVHGTPYLMCALPGSRRELFSLDSGANVSTIRKEIFDALSIESELTPFGVGSAATGGGVVHSTKAIVASLELPPFRHQNLRVDRDLRNAIGLAYLSRYKVQLDLPRGRAYFWPGSRFGALDGMATSGMSLIHSDGRKVVTIVERYGAASDADIHVGDVIEEINGQPMAKEDMFFIRQLLTSEPDTKLTVTVTRQEQRIDTTLTLRSCIPIHTTSK